MPPEGRPDLYVVARILERLWRGGRPFGKTQLQLATRVNYTVFQRYLAWLLERGLVELRQEEGAEAVVLTPKGSQAYARMVAWMRDVLEDGGAGRPP